MRLGPVLLWVFWGIVALSLVTLLLNVVKLVRTAQPLVRKIDRMAEIFQESQD